VNSLEVAPELIEKRVIMQSELPLRRMFPATVADKQSQAVALQRGNSDLLKSEQRTLSRNILHEEEKDERKHLNRTTQTESRTRDLRAFCFPLAFEFYSYNFWSRLLGKE